MAKDIFDAVYGCLIGGAIGDALGAPVEGWYWHEIRHKYNGGRITEFEPGILGNTGNSYGKKGITTLPGCFTDDTTMRHYMCLAIVRKGGRITPTDFSIVLLEKLNPDRVWLNEHIMMTKLRIGMNPWDAGKGNPPAGCSTMCIAPIGIINAGNPRQAYQDGFNIAFINQDNENRDAAATLAAGVAKAFEPGSTISDVIDTMLINSSFTINRSLIRGMDLAYKSKSIDEFAEKFYCTSLDWASFPYPPTSPEWNKDHFFSASSLEIIPLVAAVLYFTKGNANQGIIEAASLGRDCDTTASIVGCILGAMEGAKAIRQDWIDTVESANEDFFIEMEDDPKANFRSMADRMVKALINEKETTLSRVEYLKSIIGNGFGA